MQTADRRDERWSQERLYFDAQVDSRKLLPLHPATWQRYSSSRLRGWFVKEMRLKVMGDLRGKTVLDVGCNDGDNSVLYGKLGAQVTGVDISARAIERARRRAEINSVSDRVSFQCSPIETAHLPPASFDVVVCHKVLHHVVDELDDVMRKVTQYAKTDGLIVVSEPISYSRTLRRVRFALRRLVPRHGTPDERPLEPADVQVIQRYMIRPRLIRYSFLVRAFQAFLGIENYELSGWPVRLIMSALATADRAILSIPGIRNLAAVALIFGQPRSMGGRQTSTTSGMS